MGPSRSFSGCARTAALEIAQSNPESGFEKQKLVQSQRIGALSEFC